MVAIADGKGLADLMGENADATKKDAYGKVITALNANDKEFFKDVLTNYLEHFSDLELPSGEYKTSEQLFMLTDILNTLDGIEKAEKAVNGDVHIESTYTVEEDFMYLEKTLSSGKSLAMLNRDLMAYYSCPEGASDRGTVKAALIKDYLQRTATEALSGNYVGNCTINYEKFEKSVDNLMKTYNDPKKIDVLTKYLRNEVKESPIRYDGTPDKLTFVGKDIQEYAEGNILADDFQKQAAVVLESKRRVDVAEGAMQEEKTSVVNKEPDLSEPQINNSIDKK